MCLLGRKMFIHELKFYSLSISGQLDGMKEMLTRLPNEFPLQAYQQNKQVPRTVEAPKEVEIWKIFET